MRMKLFAYGTLLDPEIQKNVIGRYVYGTPDLLIGYRKIIRQFITGKFPDLQEDGNCHVEGQILELTSEELELCDSYEGTEYQRIIVELKSGVKVYVYRGI